jgi:Immunoglobulin I-set domain
MASLTDVSVDHDDCLIYFNFSWHASHSLCFTSPSILQFAELPVEFTRLLSNLEITEKETVTFECEVSRPKQTAAWYQAGGKIEPGTDNWQRFKTETEGTVHRLVIEDVQMDDAEKYSCTIKDKKTSGKLTVKGIVTASIESIRQNSFDLCLTNTIFGLHQWSH